MHNIFATTLNFAGAIASFVFGIIYLLTPKFLNYHEQAAQKKWKDIDPQIQTLILALMRAVSGGLLAGSIIIMVLQYQFNNTKQTWIPLTILVCSGIINLGLIYAMVLVKTKTAGKPPLALGFLTLALFIVGYVLNIS